MYYLYNLKRKKSYTMKKLMLLKGGNLNDVSQNYHAMRLIVIVLNVIFLFCLSEFKNFALGWAWSGNGV